jgi:cytochrome c oxidase assembly factor CtaG
VVAVGPLPAAALESSGWSFEPATIALAALTLLAYGRRVRALALRDRAVPAWRPLCFCAGVVALLLALTSPIDAIGETRLLYAHMIQHLAIGELAPLLILLGLSGPILRPLLALDPVRRLRWLLNPLVALPIWALNLYLWHLPALYELALRDGVIHVLMHACFFWAGMLMWGALLEPLPGPAWFNSAAKATYVLVVRALGCAILANVLIWAGTPLYPAYRAGERSWGIAPLADQQIAGGVMLLWGALVTIVIFAWLFLRWLHEAELRQSLLDAGVQARVAGRAARYGQRAIAPGAGPAED